MHLSTNARACVCRAPSAGLLPACWGWRVCVRGPARVPEVVRPDGRVSQSTVPPAPHPTPPPRTCGRCATQSLPP